MPDFRSFQLKLVVLEQLVDDELTARLRALAGDAYSYGHYEPVPESERLLRGLDLPDERLAGVTSLVFDGGLAIYDLLTPGWDGESDELDTTDLTDLGLLRNLEEFVVVSMIPDEVDVTPLLARPNLRRVHWRRIARDEAVATQLRARGVEVGPG
ncbi:DUF6892 domain-containing protein [Cryptosporangium sp. NPDC051539]|uniref:DUF6892 domain-containing protein n=1 Tax=Cryptosporangium sp. NPDC051539 TaxID=3363962 RepID=UPI0037A197FB